MKNCFSSTTPAEKNRTEPGLSHRNLLRKRKGLNLQGVLAPSSSTYRRVCLRRPPLRAPCIFNPLRSLATIVARNPGSPGLSHRNLLRKRKGLNLQGVLADVSQHTAGYGGVGPRSVNPVSSIAYIPSRRSWREIRVDPVRFCRISLDRAGPRRSLQHAARLWSLGAFFLSFDGGRTICGVKYHGVSRKPIGDYPENRSGRRSGFQFLLLPGLCDNVASSLIPNLLRFH